MKNLLRVSASVALLWFFVVRPMQASHLTRLAIRLNLTPTDQIFILNEAIRFEPCNETALSHMAAAATQINRFDIAVGVINQAIQCSPNDALHWMNLGEALYGEIKDGMPYMLHALKMEPWNQEFKRAIDNANAAVAKSRSSVH